MDTKQITELLVRTKDERKEAQRLYDAYHAETLPIFQRSKVKNSEICNKVNHDFRGMIVQNIVGYLIGQPVGYEYYGETEAIVNTFNDLYGELNNENNLELLDVELVESMAAAGRGSRLLYINQDGLVGVMNLEPWEAIYSENNAIRIIPQDYREAIVEVYDNSYMFSYLADMNTWMLSDAQEQIIHGFDGIPVIEFKNTKNYESDFGKVEPLIDAYDFTVSNSQDECDQHRQAILVAKGSYIDMKSAGEIRESGVANMVEGDLSYLVKDINPSFLTEHLNRIEQNIFRFSQVVDMTSEKFAGGAVTGEALKRLLLPMENKAKNKERQLVAGFRKQFKLIFGIWNAFNGGNMFDVNNLQFQFTRNLPPDVTAISQSITPLRGLISDRTLLGQIPFVQDVDQEMAQVEEERNARIDLSQFEPDNANNDNSDNSGGNNE